MKKLPLVFCLLFCACSSQKQIITDTASFGKHKQPYRIFSVGRWTNDYSVVTLKDSNNAYFTIKAAYNASLKIGDVYKP